MSPVISLGIDIHIKYTCFIFKNRKASLVLASQGWRKTFSLDDYCPHPSNRSPSSRILTQLIKVSKLNCHGNDFYEQHHLGIPNRNIKQKRQAR
jgi:hypothetical protein